MDPELEAAVEDIVKKLEANPKLELGEAKEIESLYYESKVETEWEEERYIDMPMKRPYIDVPTIMRPDATALLSLVDNVTILDVMKHYVKKRDLISIQTDKNIGDALEMFNKHRIHSMPVMDPVGNMIGLLDVLDVMKHLSEVLSYEGEESPKTWIKSYRLQFLLKDVRKIMETAESKKSLSISSAASMFEAMQKLSSGCHSLMVYLEDRVEKGTDEPKITIENIYGMITQSDIIRFLAENVMWMWLGADWNLFDLTVHELDIGTKEVISLPTTCPAYKAFEEVYKNEIYGVCIVDDETGMLLDNLSASDIKGIKKSNFTLLSLSVGDFLARDIKRPWWRLPIVASPSLTLRNLILHLAATKVHRVYTIGLDGKPTSVITITDVLKKIIEGRASVATT